MIRRNTVRDGRQKCQTEGKKRETEGKTDKNRGRRGETETDRNHNMARLSRLNYINRGNLREVSKNCWLSESYSWYMKRAAKWMWPQSIFFRGTGPAT